MDTSITLTNCAIHSKSGRMGAVLSDVRGLEGLERTFLSILSCNVGGQQILGHDGIGVGEGANGTQFLGLSGITTAFIGISFWNVSSLPGSVPSASPSFRQQMIGSSVWGSKNHLSGSTVRDMNSGGSVLCSNTTFSWCRTTSEERPSSSQRLPSSLSSNDDLITNETYDGKLGDTRLNITITTIFNNCTFQNLEYATQELWDGGSALILTTNTTHLSVRDCSFMHCSVTTINSTVSIAGGCILLRGSSSNQLRSTLSVASCSFTDWYSGSLSNREHHGGGIGTFYACASHSIVGSNFTLSGATSLSYNGGFLAFIRLENTSSPATVSNCRLQGDGQTRGNCLYIFSCDFGSGGLRISDTEIVNTNSDFDVKAVSGIKPIVVTRSNFAFGSLYVESQVVTTHDPLLFVDCTLDEFRMKSTLSSPDFYFVGTVFRTSRISYPMELFRTQGPCFVIFQSCLFDGCEARTDGLFFCLSSTSLTLDSCTMKECQATGSNSSPFHLTDTAFRAYSCTFANLTGTDSNTFLIGTNESLLLEDCRFDLDDSKKADIFFSKASPSLLNTSSVVGCTSNREIRVTTDRTTFTVCPLFKVIETPTAKSEIKLDAETDENGNLIETTDTLSPVIQSLEADSSTLLSLSDGLFTESEILSIQTDVEIVGNGTESVHVKLDESPRPHTTQLTAELEVDTAANLTLLSMTLIPYSPSSPLVTLNKEGLLSVKNVVVCDSMGRTKELFSVSGGTTHLSHSRFSSIVGSTALIVVSGNGSMSLSDTLFLTISRTQSVNGSVQSGSCVEGRTSGLISITFCKFGGCSSNGRSGAIDITSNDTTSRVEMEGCQFDQNLAGSELDEAEKGDDVVLKEFSDEQLALNFTAIESFSTLPFLINDSHPHVPAPHTLLFSKQGFDMPLAWSSPNMLCEARVSELTLQSLLGSRLHNNVHTAIITEFKYNETMQPFSLINASVNITLPTQSQINITQLNSEICGRLLNASLSLTILNLSFSELTNTVFSVDQDSSISLRSVRITFTNRTLSHPFIDSTGRSTFFSTVTIDAGLTLDSVSFVRHVRSTNDGTFTWESTSVESVSLATQPFLHLEGMRTLDITSSSGRPMKNINSLCDGSFLFAKNSNVTLSTLTASSCSALRGGFAFCLSCNVTIARSEYSSCSAQHGGVLFVELDNTNQLSSDQDSRFHTVFSQCQATAKDENGVAVGRGGAIFVKGATTAELPLNLTTYSFEKNKAAFGNDVFVEESVLGGKGPDRLKGCKGESWSEWPHFEVEGITKEENEDEWTRIATFIDYPLICVRYYGTDNDSCRFSVSNCRTLPYAFQYLQTSYPNGTVYPRSASLGYNFTFEPMFLEEVNLLLKGSTTVELSTTVPAGSSMFTVGKDSRLTLQIFNFQHKVNHTLVSVTSRESWLEMRSCDVVLQPGTYSQTLVLSVGCGLSLESFRVNGPSASLQVTFSVPIVSFHPTPPPDGGLGSAPFSMTRSTFKNLTLSNSSIIVVETSGNVIFQMNNFTRVQSDLDEGQYLSLKGYNFKQQIVPENWANNYSKDELAALCGEDTSLAENHKWRRGSLVYWLFSPLEEIVVNPSDSDAVDHPNCGSSEFKCSTLDSALESASLNSLKVITLSSPSSLERTMKVAETRTVRSSDTTQRDVSVALDSSVPVDGGALSFLAIQFTSASSSAFSNGENIRTDPLFVVESGSLSLDSCSLSSFTLVSCPMISHVSGSLSLMSCELSSIDRLSGKGSILSTEMTSGMELRMDGVNLSSMPCSSESPAVLLNFSSITPSSPSPSFSLTNLRVERTDEQLATARFAEIVGQNISSFISEEDERFKGSYSQNSNSNDLWSVDEDLTLSATLLLYLLKQAGPVRVSRGGSDADRCGYLNVWCSSIERAVSRTTDRPLSELIILGDSDLSSAVLLTNNVSITKGEEAGTVHVASAGSLTNSARHTLILEELAFALPPTQTAEAVIIVPPSGSATLNTIVVSSPGGSDATLVRVTGGRAEMTDSLIQSEMKENTYLVEIVGGKVSVNTLRVESGIGLNSSIVWMSMGSVNVSGLSIVDVSSISGRLVVASGTFAQLKDITLSHISFSSTPFLFSSLDSCSLITVSATDFSSKALLEGKDVKSLQLNLCQLSGSTKSTSEQNEEVTDICSWMDSSITLTNCSSAFHSVEMKHIPQGAVSIVGGELTLTYCTFIDNSPSNIDFPSLRRNVMCSEGKVSIEAVGGGDGHSSPHHWISTHNCSVEKEDKVLPTPFFIPTLSSTESTSTFDRKAEMYEIVLTGETFIPCGLSLEVFERVKLSESEFSEGEHILVELDASEVTSWKEDSIELLLHQSTLALLSKKHDLHCRMRFGESGKTDSFSLTGLKGNMSQGGRVVSVIVPIVCSVVLLLLLLIVVLVLVCRRQQKKKKEEKPKAMSELDECQIEVKDEDMDLNSTIQPLFNTSDVTLHPSSLNMISNGIDQDQPQFSSFRQPFIEQVEALKYEGELAVVRVPANRSLYSALHVEKRSDLPKMEIRRQLVAGLNRLVQHNPFSDVLTQLSSHWILIDSAGSVCLKLDQNLNETDLTEHQIANRKKMREEDRRWSAPEQIDEDDRDINKDEKEPQAAPFDPLKASVFRLGLVLWELETGLVPFGELDAANASRQVKGGQVPLIENWEDTSLASIVGECLSFDPNDRPSLSDLKKHFSTSPPHPDPPPIHQQPANSV
ncbi:hypothetical protein BLNAU_9124 [Blattamonas nauphoetae]|uniref:Protein kinase domain-containing protein n=1 Tax=Blattamonas nauphoetae TaxID=2049346 RepID=A0ABQ9XWU9_9EUKA|nr:hypothetical protein BLNAU_9124 [Blattamonas nauphoetae]